MKGEGVPVEARELDYRAAELGAELEAARWLEIRARGPVPRGPDERLTAALQALKRAGRKLEETRKRVARAA